jgi:tetratricopeptide (TPR) repeat protein
MKQNKKNTHTLILALVMAGVCSTQVVAQDNIATAESALYRGEQLMLSGSYAAASDVFLLADGLDRNEGIIGASKAYAFTGNYEQAIRITEEAIEDGDYARFPLLSTQLAEIKRAVGESSEALAILSSVIEGQFEAPVRTLVQYGSLLQFVGQKQEAYGYLDQVVQRYNDGSAGKLVAGQFL